MEFRMIELIKANPVLYSHKYRSVRYRHKRLDKWEEIASELGRDATTLRIRWKTLRDTYRRLKKMREDGEDILSLKYWKYFDHMTFLDEHFVPVLKEELKDEGDFDIQMEQDNNTSFEHSTDGQPATSSSNQPGCEFETFDLGSYIKKVDRGTLSDANTSSKSKSNRFEREDIINEACQEMTNLLRNAKQHFTPPTANQLFFNSLAAQVEEAKLPALNAMRLQQRILEIVTQEIVLYQDTPYEEV